MATEAATLTERLAARAQAELKRHTRAIERSPSELAGVTVELDVRPSGELGDVHLYIAHRSPARPERARRPT